MSRRLLQGTVNNSRRFTVLSEEPTPGSFPGEQAAPLPGRVGDGWELPEQQDAQKDARLGLDGPGDALGRDLEHSRLKERAAEPVRLGLVLGRGFLSVRGPAP